MLIKIVDNMQEQRGNISRDGNPKKNPNGKYKKYKTKQKLAIPSGRLSIQWKCVRKESASLGR